MKVSLRNKDKSIETAIDSAFLKSETLWKELILDEIVAPNRQNEKANIKIKLEVDTDPPPRF